MYHKDSFEVTTFYMNLLDIYWKELAVKIFMVHDYLGMYFYYSYPGVAKISMMKYLHRVLDELP